MTTLTISVSDETLAEEIDSWEDGEEYTLVVKQTAAGEFELISGELNEVEEEPEEPVAPTKPPGKKGENPAIALVIAAQKQPKK